MFEIDGQRWVRLVVIGQSFMLHQIRKMVRAGGLVDGWMGAWEGGRLARYSFFAGCPGAGPCSIRCSHFHLTRLPSPLLSPLPQVGMAVAVMRGTAPESALQLALRTSAGGWAPGRVE